MSEKRENPVDRRGMTRTAAQRAARDRRKGGADAMVTPSTKQGYVEVYAKHRGRANTESLAAEIQDAMDVTKQHRAPVIIEDNNRAGTVNRGMVRLQYLRVTRRTEKAVLISFGSCRRWMALSMIEFLPGCLVEMSTDVAIKKGLWARVDKE